MQAFGCLGSVQRAVCLISARVHVADTGSRLFSAAFADTFFSELFTVTSAQVLSTYFLRFLLVKFPSRMT